MAFLELSYLDYTLSNVPAFIVGRLKYDRVSIHLNDRFSVIAVLAAYWLVDCRSEKDRVLDTV